MELTAAHLRYLLAIYEVSQTHLDICSRSIAEKLNVTKPSVVRIMNLLMDRGMIVKEHYGKIYLTDRGIFVAKAVRAQLETVLTHFPPVRIDMTEEERYNAALALTSALPERAFTGEYDRLFGRMNLKRRTLRDQQETAFFDRKALRYVGLNVLFQWLGMLCNVVLVMTVSRLIGGVFAGSLTAMPSGRGCCSAC